MKKAILAALALVLCASTAMAAWAPSKMVLVAPSSIEYKFDGSTLNIPISVTGKPGTGFFCVYTQGDSSNIVGVRNGFKDWHYVNKIDTSVYISPLLTFPSAGDYTVPWDGKNSDGVSAAKDTYTYYLWAYNSLQAEETVSMSFTQTISGGGKSVTIQKNGPNGLPMDQPIFYSSNHSGATPIRKWVVGTEPTDDASLIRTTFATPEAFNGIAYGPAFMPGDFSKFYLRMVNTTTKLQGIVRENWVDNGICTVDTEWGTDESGYISWTNTAYGVARYNVSGPVIIGDYIYASNNTIGTKLDPFSDIQSYSWADGSYNATIDLTSWWVNTLYGEETEGSPSSKNGGPSGLIPWGNYLVLNAHLSCMKQLINPLAETAADVVVWSNGNGDGFIDKNASDAAGHPWVCFDTQAAPYTYSADPDANGFVAVTAYTDGSSTAFVLLGPDGTGLGECGYNSQLTGYKAFSSFVDNGSAYDGLYTDKQVAVNDPGIYYVAHDSFKGSIVPPPEAVNTTTPSAFTVSQNSPNPFNPTTTITFKLMKEGKTTVEVFNAAGQKVDTVVNSNLRAGSHSVTWNAAKFSAGVYFYTVKSGSFSKTMKMTLLK